MTAITVRPFAPALQRHGNAPLRPGRFTRVALAPLAARKGFGDQKKEQAKRQEAADAPQQQPPPPQQQQQGMSYDAPPAAPARNRVIRETPQIVVDRMFRRILIFTGVPIFTGMALFPLFYWLRVVQDIDYPLWIVYISQLLTFGGGLLGITYGALSSSWDPSREGSALGWSEMQANLAIVFRGNKQE